MAKRPHIDPNARDPESPWNDEWLNEPDFKDWAFTRDGYVYCSACKQQHKKSKFTTGKPVSHPWIRNQLVQHTGGQKHKKAEEERKQAVAAAHALKCKRHRALEMLALPLTIIIRLVYWLCVENVAMMKLASLFGMVTTLPKLRGAFGCAIPENYVNAARCREFVMALDSVIKSKLWVDIQCSKFVTICIDESTDVSTSENLIIYRGGGWKRHFLRCLWELNNFS